MKTSFSNPNFKTQKVNSSNIDEIGYDEKNRLLLVVFKDKGRGVSKYHYYPVEKEMYNALMKSSSKGSYFAENIRSNRLIAHNRVG